MIVSAPSELTFKMIDILSKEDHEVCFESYEDFPKDYRPKNPYLHFKNNVSFGILEKQVQTISPDVILYLRSDFESSDYSNNFISFLDLSVNYKARFVYLSNLDTLYRSESLVTEASEVRPISLRGEVAAQCENRILMKHQSYGLEYLILRADYLYGRSKQDDNAFVRIGKQVMGTKRIRLDSDFMVYPVHCDDAAYAIKLAMDSGHDNEIYHVLGDQGLLLSKLYSQVAEQISKKVTVHSLKLMTTEISRQHISSQLEWICFHELEDELMQFAMPTRAQQEAESGKKKEVPLWRSSLRQTIEITLLFVLFVLLDQMVMNVLAQGSMDCMLIYIVLVALRYRAGWTYTSVSLAMLYNFLKRGGEAFARFGFFAFAGDIAHGMLYLLIGIMVSFAVETLRGKNTEIQYNMDAVVQEKEDLLEINTKLLMVKNEYEKRLLGTKYSFSSLYSVLNRISVMHPDKILVELMGIISDVLETKTVSIYTINNRFARMMVALNDESIYRGKSWDIMTTDPEMYKVLSQGEIFRGDTFKGEPALVAPIMRNQNTAALVVINEMKFENMSLYYMNLLKTLMVISGDMVHKANVYYNEVKHKFYLPGTQIVSYDWFKQLIRFEKEKTSSGFSTFFLVRCDGIPDAKAGYDQLKGLFRSTDAFGVDDRGRLYMLFQNVAVQDRPVITDKIERKGIRVEMVDDID